MPLACDKHRQTDLRIYVQNPRSIKNKLKLLYNAAASCDYHILAFTETWLNTGIINSEILPTDYTIFRSDRKFESTGLKRGGGILLAINSQLSAHIVDVPNLDLDVVPLVDLFCVKVTLDNFSLFIILTYIVPNTSHRALEALFDSLCACEFLYSSPILLLGDFNIPEYVAHLKHKQVSNRVRALLSLMNFFDLKQLNHIENSNGRLLDLVLSNITGSVERASDLLLDEDVHHPALEITLCVQHTLQSRAKALPASFTYCFRRADLCGLYDHLLTTDWSFLDHCNDVDMCCDQLYATIYSIFDTYIPKTQTRAYREYPPWFDGEIIRYIRLKFKSWKRFKSSNDPLDYAEFRRLRQLVKTLSDSKQRLYSKQVEDSIHADPSKFFRFANHKRTNSTHPSSMTYCDEPLSDPSDIVEAFAKFFQQSYSSDAIDYNNVTHTLSTPTLLLDITEVSEDQVYKALCKIKPKLTSGPDQIPAFLVRDCASLFVAPLTAIFNISLKSSKFPNIWKMAKSVPIPKKGDKTVVENYRQIVLMDNFPKVFEIILYEVLYFNLKNLITEAQHGFMRGRSTVTNLVCITDYISSGLDMRAQTDAIYLDFSKAFDKLNHPLLLQKLSSAGLSSNLLEFFASYLADRSYHVSYRGRTSTGVVAWSGVPQGSVLGPLLFNLFVNDITEVIDVPHLLYADDLKIFLKIENLEDCAQLQGNLNRIHSWASRNRLPINIQKCEVMTFSLSQSPIEFNYSVGGIVLRRPETLTDLGVIFDHKLSFIHHIENIVSRASKTLGFLVRNSTTFTKTDTLMILYNAYVIPILEYASTVWSPIYEVHINALELVQRRFLKLMVYRSDGVYPAVGTPQVNLLNRFCMDSLLVRRTICCLTFLWNLLNNFIDCPQILYTLSFLTPRLSCRSHDFFYIAPPRTNIRMNSPIIRMCTTYNSVHHSVDILNCSRVELRSSASLL